MVKWRVEIFQDRACPKTSGPKVPSAYPVKKVASHLLYILPGRGRVERVGERGRIEQLTASQCQSEYLAYKGSNFRFVGGTRSRNIERLDAVRAYELCKFPR